MTPAPNPPLGLRLHPFQDVAEQLKLNLRSLRERARRREFTHVRIGRERYLTDEQLQAFVAANTVTTQRADALAATRARVARQRSRRSRS